MLKRKPLNAWEDFSNSRVDLYWNGSVTAASLFPFKDLSWNISGRTPVFWDRNLLCLMGLLKMFWCKKFFCWLWYRISTNHNTVSVCPSIQLKVIFPRFLSVWILPESHKPRLLTHVWVVSLEFEGVVGRGGSRKRDVGGVERIKGRISAIN